MALRNISQGARLREKAYAAIKEAILSLELPPGHALAELELVNLLGVSRTPIRDALLQLEREGFVVIRPFRGAVVSEMASTDLQEIFLLRELIEPPVVRLAVPRFTAEDIGDAQALIDQMHRALEQELMQEYSQLSNQFHWTYVRKLANRWVEQVLEHLHDHLTRIRAVALVKHSAWHQFLGDYELVLDATRRGDAAAAESAMRFHLNRVLNVLLESTNGNGNGTT